MNTRTILAWLLILSLTPAYTEAKPGKTRVASTRVASRKAPQQGLVAAKPAATAKMNGRLTADAPILINGNRATSGETVFSGATIETPAGAGATVQLGALGQMDLGPSSKLTLVFDREVIRGEVVKGCATVAAVKGITGYLAMPGNITKRTDPAIGETLSACTYESEGLIGASGTRCTTQRVAAAKDDDNWKFFALLLLGGGALAGGVVAAVRNSDGPCINPSLSPFTPCR